MNILTAANTLDPNRPISSCEASVLSRRTCCSGRDLSLIRRASSAATKQPSPVMCGENCVCCGGDSVKMQLILAVKMVSGVCCVLVMYKWTRVPKLFNFFGCQLVVVFAFRIFVHFCAPHALPRKRIPLSKYAPVKLFSPTPRRIGLSRRIGSPTRTPSSRTCCLRSAPWRCNSRYTSSFLMPGRVRCKLA